MIMQGQEITPWSIYLAEQTLLNKKEPRTERNTRQAKAELPTVKKLPELRLTIINIQGLEKPQTINLPSNRLSNFSATQAQPLQTNNIIVSTPLINTQITGQSQKEQEALSKHNQQIKEYNLICQQYLSSLFVLAELRAERLEQIKEINQPSIKHEEGLITLLKGLLNHRKRSKPSLPTVNLKRIHHEPNSQLNSRKILQLIKREDHLRTAQRMQFLWKSKTKSTNQQ